MRKKWLLWGVGSIVFLALAGLIALALNLGRVAKLGIEQFGPAVLGVPVSVKTVFLSPFTGRGLILGLKIGNPKGYEAENFFEVGRIAIKVDVASLASNPIRVRLVEIKTPHIEWEGNFSQSNLSQIKGHAQNFSGPSGPPSKKGEGQTRVIIDKLEISGIQAGAKFRALGKLSLSPPDIVLTDIGKGNGGATFSEVAQTLFARLSASVIEALRTSPEVIDAVTDKVGKAGGAILKGVKSLFGN